MIVYNSMLVLVLLLAVVYKLQTPDRVIRLTQPIPWPYAIISMGYIVFWAALRSGFSDTRMYIERFKYLPTGFDAAIKAFSENDKSPGFDFIQILFKTEISSDFHWWLASIAIISGIPIMLTLRKQSVDYLFSMFLFVTSLTFSWMLNGIRQFLVASILFGFYFLLIERKRVLFIAIVLIGSLIHQTVIILLPAVLLIDCKPFGKSMMAFVVLILSSAFFLNFMLDTMDTVLQDNAYHASLDQFAEDDGTHPLRVLLESVPVVMAFFKRKQIASLNNKLINLCINMSTVAAGLYYISMLTSGINMGRLPIYFSLYNLILIPFLINYVYSKHYQLIYGGFYICYIAFYFLLTSHYYYISDILGNYF